MQISLNHGKRAKYFEVHRVFETTAVGRPPGASLNRATRATEVASVEIPIRVDAVPYWPQAGLARPTRRIGF